jgi:hypothetical protein
MPVLTPPTRPAAQVELPLPGISIQNFGHIGSCSYGVAQAAKPWRTHHVIPRAGHNLPQEEPEAFAGAVMELIKA